MSRSRITKDDEYAGVVESSFSSVSLIEHVANLIQSGHGVLTSSAETAYLAFLAYYVANGVGIKGSELLDYAASLASSVGLVKLPSMSDSLAEKLK
jgi:hypothetical protein